VARSAPNAYVDCVRDMRLLIATAAASPTSGPTRSSTWRTLRACPFSGIRTAYDTDEIDQAPRSSAVHRVAASKRPVAA
jgi:hypothetical protein